MHTLVCIFNLKAKMKKLLLLALLSAFYCKAQLNTPENTKPFIEVSGTGETEVVPDELYITITLTERPENREKLNIAKQEESLKQAVKELGIDQANLALSEAYADFRKVKTLKKDVIVSKTYILKISSTDMLAKVYDKLDKINAQDAYISKVSHSKIQQITKDNRIKALKAAKEKVDYLLAAVGQQAGQPLQITESGNDIFQPYQYNFRMMKAANVYSEDGAADAGSDIEFKKIKITSTYIVKYEITHTK